MKRLATTPSSQSALERGVSPGGATALDPSVPDEVWQRALIGPAEEFLSRPGKALRSMLSAWSTPATSAPTRKASPIR